jgi:Tfp pilus assembly protein PilF
MGYDFDWHSAEASYRRALELAPRNTTVLTGTGWLLRATGRIEEAIGVFDRAVEQDPLSSTAYHNLATTLYYANRLDEAETAFRKALELAPTRAETRTNLAMALLRQRRIEESMREAILEPSAAFGLCARAIVNHAQGDGAGSDLALRELEQRYAADGAYQIAEVYATRGEMDPAFAWLERALDQKDGGLTYLLGDPLFEQAREDPRWKAFLAKMGLPAVDPPSARP